MRSPLSKYKRKVHRPSPEARWILTAEWVVALVERLSVQDNIHGKVWVQKMTAHYMGKARAHLRNAPPGYRNDVRRLTARLNLVKMP